MIAWIVIAAVILLTLEAIVTNFLEGGFLARQYEALSAYVKNFYQDLGAKRRAQHYFGGHR